MMSPKGGLLYAHDLIEAVWNGTRGAMPRSGTRVPNAESNVLLFAGAALGAGAGVLSACWRKRQASADLARAGLFGGAVGLGAGAAWMSRRQARTAARQVLRNISAVRDAHWLAGHPIDYA